MAPLKRWLRLPRRSRSSRGRPGADAGRFSRRYSEWDRTGVSGYYALDENEVSALCQTEMVNFETVVVFAIRDLEHNTERGFRDSCSRISRGQPRPLNIPNYADMHH